MSARGPGRPREEGEGDWLTVQETADRLGVTYQAIHKRIQRGTIEYDEWIEEGESRPHLRIPLSAIEGDVESGELDRRSADRARRIEEVLLSGLAELARAVESQHKDQREGFRQILENQTRLIELVVDALKQMENQAERMREESIKQDEARETEKSYQREMLDLSRRVASRLEGSSEASRGFWSRIFRPE
jgi:hypothetical protein